MILYASHKTISDAQIASTPLMTLRRGAKTELINIHNTISPIYDTISPTDDNSYILTKAASAKISPLERTYDMHSTTIINSGTIVKKTTAKRDILSDKVLISPEKKTYGLPMPQRSQLNRVSPTNTGIKSNFLF